MKIIVGLGNPGEKYQNNRHNVGFMVMDKLIGEGRWDKSKSGKLLYHWTKIGGEDVELVKPQIFMNRSGEALLYIKSKHPDLKSEEIHVIHDDLDIKLGEYKIQKGKGPKDHRGLNSIYEALSTKDFWHVRIGVDSRDPEDRTPGEDYVLQDFTLNERVVLERTINEVCKKLATF